MEHYEEYKGIHFTIDTPKGVRKAIVQAKESMHKVRIYYGNMKTGECYLRDTNIMGVIDVKSNTKYNIPVLKKTLRSKDGVPIQDNEIMCIEDLREKKYIYRDNKFYIPEVKANGRAVEKCKDGEWLRIAMCETEKEAEKLAKFYLGLRNTK